MNTYCHEMRQCFTLFLYNFTVRKRKQLITVVKNKFNYKIIKNENC